MEIETITTDGRESLEQLAEAILKKGMKWARRRRELTILQNRRKSVQIKLRERLMASAEARGESLSKTAAMEAARVHPEYMECLDEIASKQYEADVAEVEYATMRALYRAAAAEEDGPERLAA